MPKEFKEIKREEGNELFTPSWVDSGPDPEFREVSQFRLDWITDIDELAQQSPYSVATIHKIYPILATKYGYSKGTTRVYLHRLVKMGWLRRQFVGGYRLTDAARKWVDDNKKQPKKPDKESILTVAMKEEEKKVEV